MENDVNVGVINNIGPDNALREDGIKKQKLVLAGIVVTALCGLAGTIIKSRQTDQRPTDAPATAMQAQVSFAGRVSDGTGKSISGAVVLATTDQNVGQSIKTDSNGQFQLLLPPTAQTLRLSITADGFRPQIVQADVHRTGPEEITLSSATPPNPLKVEHPPSRGSAPKPVVVAPSSAAQPAAPLPAPTINQGFINNGTNNGIQNNCPYGGCDQSVSVNDPVIPEAYFDQEPFIDYEHPNLNTNGISTERNSESIQTLHIHVRGVFDNPVFEISCDSPCNIDRPFMGRRSGANRMEHNTSLYVHGVTPDLMHHLLAFEDRLSPAGYFSLRVSSRNRQPLKITSVRSSRLPSNAVN